jgi:hypothetical protein
MRLGELEADAARGGQKRAATLGRGGLRLPVARRRPQSECGHALSPRSRCDTVGLPRQRARRREARPMWSHPIGFKQPSAKCSHAPAVGLRQM